MKCNVNTWKIEIQDITMDTLEESNSKFKAKAEGQNNFCLREQKENQTHYPLGTSKLEI